MALAKSRELPTGCKMPSTTKSDSFSLPARAVAAFIRSGAGTATVDGTPYAIGQSDVRIGPFTSAKTVNIALTSGTIAYAIEPGATEAALVTADGQIVTPTGRELKLAQFPGVPIPFASRALASADDSANLICATAQVATVNTGLPSGFGCSFKGAITFAGSATVTDVRTTGAANPWCALVQTGVDAYDVVGAKA